MWKHAEVGRKTYLKLKECVDGETKTKEQCRHHGMDDFTYLQAYVYLMEESSVTNDVVLDVNKDVSRIITSQHSRFCLNVSFLQKRFDIQLVAEAVGTYLLIFAGCASVVVNKNNNGIVTLPGVAITWGLTVTALVYSVGHISGGHFNPAVTIAFSSIGRFPFKQVPAYVIAQVAGSTLASGTLRLIFDGKHDQFPGTLPAGSNLQSFVLEFIITFFLMFVISGVATDSRATGEFAGIAVGFTVLLNVMIAGYYYLIRSLIN
ncbi:hypothetical protein Fmac_004537 [Flemingia macrophylla]|uniref:Uncharacterized protein n=1 Tax=Flemingia macrophylla TaxID=520843 RepID=A0ABD1N577_9FABA